MAGLLNFPGHIKNILQPILNLLKHEVI
jgi:hypothetical protein